jgi:hypothetical protein
MIFIEGESSHDKRMNLTLYESSWSILLDLRGDDIYWRGALPLYEKEFDSLGKLDSILLAMSPDDIY